MKIFYSETVSWTELGAFVFVFDEVANAMYKFTGILKDFWLTIDKDD